MPYTLMKGWVWVLLGVLLGIVIGWLLRSIVAKRQVARARQHTVDAAELERLRGQAAQLDRLGAERDRLQSELDRRNPDSTARARAPDPQSRTEDQSGFRHEIDQSAPRDVARAGAVLGAEVTLDDLKVIEGIGPKVESLCHGIGIRTWSDMATTEVSLLRTMLTDAGSRFAGHDPSTWPEQAGLLAAGRWDDFKAFTDGLRGGRPTD